MGREKGVATHRTGANEGVLSECGGLLAVAARAVYWQGRCVDEDGCGAGILGGVLEGSRTDGRGVEVVGKIGLGGECGK